MAPVSEMGRSSSDDEPPDLVPEEIPNADSRTPQVLDRQSRGSSEFFGHLQDLFKLDWDRGRRASQQIISSGASGISTLWDAVSDIGSQQMDVLQRNIEQTAFWGYFQEMPVHSILAPFTVILIMGSTYVTFACVYLPAAKLGVLSTQSVFFKSCFVMSAISYYYGVTVDPGHVPEAWRELPIDPLTGRRYQLIERKKKDSNELRWCQKEKLYKPDRAHFCRSAGHNVLRMDHYCPWLLNTVGYFNHKYFYLFILYSVTDINLTLIHVFPSLLLSTHNATQTVMLMQGTFLTGVITSCLTPFLVFHSWLIAKNLTTIEWCEKQGSDGHSVSPYDVGVVGNIKSIMGDAWYLWLVPLGGPSGDGLHWRVRDGVLPLPDTDEEREEETDQSCTRATEEQLQLDSLSHSSATGSTGCTRANVSDSEASVSSSAGGVAWTSEPHSGLTSYSWASELGREAEALRSATVNSFCRCISKRDGQSAHHEGARERASSSSASATAEEGSASSRQAEEEGSVSMFARQMGSFFHKHENYLGPLPGAIYGFTECLEDAGDQTFRIVDRCRSSIQARIARQTPAGNIRTTVDASRSTGAQSSTM